MGRTWARGTCKLCLIAIATAAKIRATGGRLGDLAAKQGKMSTKPTQMAGASGPHFLSHFTEAQFAPSAKAADKLSDACNALAGKIESAGFNGSSPADAACELAQWDEQVFRLAADAAGLEHDAGAAPPELAQAAARDWRRLARSLALTDCQAACDELLRQCLKEAGQQCAAARSDTTNPSALFDAWLRRHAATRGLGSRHCGQGDRSAARPVTRGAPIQAASRAGSRVSGRCDPAALVE